MTSDSRIGTTIDGRYRIDARLGAGGMATVYRATRLLIGDEVAIKILHGEQLLEPAGAERFRREAQAAARLKHPNAVTIHDFGIAQDGLVYLVMELIKGQSLASYIKEHGPLSPPVAADILRQVCGALTEAHENKIIHRDLKPDNIAVSRSGNGDLIVKVLDFGIARMLDTAPAQHLTLTGTVIGTPHYMSPEQCLAEELDHRSDIYSLGIVVYEMLTGTVPFKATTPVGVAVHHVNTPPARLRSVNSSIPAALESVVMRALEKKKEHRPPTSAAFSEEFAAAVRESANAPERDDVTVKRAKADDAPTRKIPTPRPATVPKVPAAPRDVPAAPPAQADHRPRFAAFVLVSIVAAATILAALWWQAPAIMRRANPQSPSGATALPAVAGPIVELPPAILFRPATPPQPAAPIVELVADAERDLAGRPGDPEALSNAGALVWAAGDKRRGGELLARAHNTAPENPVIAYNLARSLFDNGRRDEAVRLAGEALGRRPAFDEAFLLLAAAEVLNQNYAAAEAHLQRVVNRGGAFFSIQGTINLFGRKHDESVDAFQQAVTLAPGSATALYNLALGHQQQGELARAEQLYREALSKNPDLEAADQNLATVVRRER